MKTKVTNATYEQIIAMERPKHKKPKKPSIFFRALMSLISLPDIIKTRFTYTKVGMERLKKGEPMMILMNHSCFLDLEIVPTMLFPRPFNIVATSDAFIGRKWLLKQIGCIPTNKFVTDTTLVRDMMHTLRKLKSSVVMFPEAGYTYHGKSMPLPDSIGKMVKMMGAPLVMIRTDGAYLYDPLYNNLQTRKVKVSAEMKYLLSPEEIKEMSAEEIQEIVLKEFSFDNLSWQKDNNIKITEKFRADGLNRLLYKCPHCMAEGHMVGKGTTLSCPDCKKVYTLLEDGSLHATDGDSKFTHIPDWYEWQREAVRAEIEAGSYGYCGDVEILMTTHDYKFYRVGDGVLKHSDAGFVLDGCEGALHYEHKPLCAHTVNADFYFYQIGDVISFGNNDYLFYCFPKAEGDVVCKMRIAAEEIFKIKQKEKAEARLSHAE